MLHPHLLRPLERSVPRRKRDRGVRMDFLTSEGEAETRRRGRGLGGAKPGGRGRYRAIMRAKLLVRASCELKTASFSFCDTVMLLEALNAAFTHKSSIRSSVRHGLHPSGRWRDPRRLCSSQRRPRPGSGNRDGLPFGIRRAPVRGRPRVRLEDSNSEKSLLGSCRHMACGNTELESLFVDLALLDLLGPSFGSILQDHSAC